MHITADDIHFPCYVLEERLLRRNLRTIKTVADSASVDIILAFKAYALWKTFPIFREYIHATTASSLWEARLAVEEFGSKAHTYSPAYTDSDIDEITRCSSHITFNSLSQYERYHSRVKALDPQVSIGVRINPEYCEVGTALYNPCSPGTRFGITADRMPKELPADIEGFHCHCHCESDADVFVRTLRHITAKFGRWIGQLKWINFGGGHLMTRRGYDIPLLIATLKGFHAQFPNLNVILEPGSAFAWHTGMLVAQVADVVVDNGVSTAILNVSFTCHMPDCLEMPYMPDVRGAVKVDDEPVPAGAVKRDHVYRLGGCSCLAGDFLGSWRFDHELNIGENIVFEDMLHYTTVKTTMFNGVNHPAIALIHEDGQMETLRRFSYSDYRDRMD